MKLIFVAGCPRSGSTWLSRALGEATLSPVIHEPFNCDQNPDLGEYEMKYMPEGTRDPRFAAILRAGAREVRGRRWWINALQGRAYLVLKEVHAVLAVEHLWELYAPATVILLRHPCAVASSWMRLKWFSARRRIEKMLAQELLMKDHLAPFESHLRSGGDACWEVGAFWGAAYYVLLRLAAAHPQWQVVRHEDLCIDPVSRVEALARKLGLSMSEQGRQFLRMNDHEPAPEAGPYSLSRDSRQELRKAQEALDAEAAKQVLRGAEPFGVLGRYYGALPVAVTAAAAG